jgi:hypothetical protein
MINYTPPTQHTSLFYNSEEEYLDIILPFLKAGLENNEFCLWNLPEDLKVDDAYEHLRKNVENLDVYLQKGQLSVRSYDSFYLKDGVFSGHKVLQSFVDLEKKVLDEGFKGIRVTGDGSWALGDNWFGLMTYEKEVNRVIELYKIRALCSYYIPKLQLKDIYDIGTSHQSSLVKQMGNWNRLDSSRFTQAKID